jgi:hypothetical protein
MSLITQAIPYVAGFAEDLVLALFKARNIGGFVADITVSERHRDNNIITQHPVETGSVISDHVYKSPSLVIIQVGYSNSSLQAMGDSNYVQNVYQNFLSLMNSKTTFSVTTGKRQFNNMLIEYIAEMTDEKTENSMFLEIACREILFVSTQTVTTAGMGNSTNQTNPSSTASASQQGTQQLQTTDNINIPALYSAGIPQADVLH